MLKRIGYSVAWFVLCISAFGLEWSDSQIFLQVQKEFPEHVLGEYLSTIAVVTDSRNPKRRTRLIVFADHNGDATHFVGFDPDRGRINMVDDEGNADDPRNKQFFEVSEFRRGMQVVKLHSRTVIELTARKDLMKGRPVPIDMDYLYRGSLFGRGEYKNLPFEMRFEADKWGLYRGQKLLKSIHLIANKIFGKVVGIKEVQIH